MNSEKSLSHWSIGKDEMFDTGRGLLFKTIFLFKGVPVFSFHNDGRGGADYIESIKNEFGITKFDFKKDVEEFLKENGFQLFGKKIEVEYMISDFYFYKDSECNSFKEFLSDPIKCHFLNFNQSI